jgi:hypothetical protein
MYQLAGLVGPLMRPLISMGFAVMSTLLMATATQADLISYEFTGSVKLTFGGSFFGVTPALGDPVTGTFTYDTSIPGVPDGPYYSFYDQPQSSQLAVTVRGITISSDMGYTMSIADDVNNVPYDDFQIFNNGSRVNVSRLGVQEGSVQFELYDPTGTAFRDQSLPTHLDLSSFSVSGSQGEVYASGPGIFSGVVFSVDSLTIVPEPGTFSLLVALIIMSVTWHLWQHRKGRARDQSSRCGRV